MTRTKLAFSYAFVACMLSQSCKSDVPPAAATPPEPPLFPAPPALPAGSSRCVVRHIVREDKAWQVETYAYDAATRVLSGWMHFDAEGRVTKREGSHSDETLTYDAHGNLQESRRWDDKELVDGVYWDNRYEGNPPRLVARHGSEIRKPNERRPPHIHTSYFYNAAGNVIEDQEDGPRGLFIRQFTWRAGRVVEVRGALGPPQPGDTIGYGEGETFDYDAQGRLTAYVRDGDSPFGEGAFADGKPDQRETFYYDAAGRLERIERDGQVGDVAPETADGKPDEITLLSPPCDPLVKLAPWLFNFPQLYLPNSIAPRLR